MLREEDEGDESDKENCNYCDEWNKVEWNPSRPAESPRKAPRIQRKADHARPTYTGLPFCRTFEGASAEHSDPSHTTKERETVWDKAGLEYDTLPATWESSAHDVDPSHSPSHGLPNMGQTCYQNASIQALSACKRFMERIEAAAEGTDIDAVAAAALRLLKQQFRGKSGGSNAALSHMHSALEADGNRFSSRGHQHDAEEFVGFLLDRFESSLSVKASQDWLSLTMD